MDGPKSIPPDSRHESLPSSEKPTTPLESKISSLANPIFQSQQLKEPPKLSLQLPSSDADDLDSPVEEAPSFTRTAATKQSLIRRTSSEDLISAEEKLATIHTLYESEGKTLNPNFFHDPDVMLIAIELDPKNFNHASDQLKADLAFLTKAGVLSPEIVKRLNTDPTIKKEKQEELLKYIKENHLSGPGIEVLKNTLTNALN